MEREDYLQREKENNITIARGITEGMKSIFERQRKIDDPCLRNCLFVDKLSMSLDVMMAVLSTACRDHDMPEDLVKDIQNLKCNIDQELSQLMEWVRSPMYSPDSGFGRNYVEMKNKAHGFKEL